MTESGVYQRFLDVFGFDPRGPGQVADLRKALVVAQLQKMDSGVAQATAEFRAKMAEGVSSVDGNLDGARGLLKEAEEALARVDAAREKFNAARRLAVEANLWTIGELNTALAKRSTRRAA